MSVIVGRALPGGPRRPQAGAPPRAVRDVRLRLPARPQPREVRALGRRDDGQLPPARRLVDLRHPGPDGPAVVAALPAGRRPGQLRFAGQRSAGRHALHRGAADAAGDGDAARNRRGDSRFHPELRRPGAGADGPAQPVPEPAGQRFRRHRGRHGHQHPAAQPARARRGRLLGLDNYEADEEATLAAVHGAGQGPRLPDLRADRRRRRASTTPTPPAAARSGCAAWSRSRRTRKGRTALVITELPYQVNHDNFITSIAEQVRDGKLDRHLQHRGPVQRPGRHAHRRRDQARRGGQGGAEQPLQAHPAADQLRRQHAVDRRRGAAHAAARPDDPATTSPTSSTSSSGAPRYRLRKANERAHILRGLVKALDALDEVIALDPRVGRPSTSPAPA